MLKQTISSDKQLYNGATLKVLRVDGSLFETELIYPVPRPENRVAIIGRVRFRQEATFEHHTLFRNHIPLVMAFVETVHASQGNDEHNGVGFFIDASDRTVWTRDMLYTLLSRVHHLAQLFLLGLDENVLMSLLLQALPRALHIDEWIAHTNVLSISPERGFIPKRYLFRPLPPCPANMWITYLIANKQGMTTIGASNEQERRLSHHNAERHQRQPAIMAALPKGWQMYAWVGPFQNRHQAETFESLWKAQGVGQHLRNVTAHIVSAYKVLARHANANATVHYDFVRQ